jgi:hypothetical protein
MCNRQSGQLRDQIDGQVVRTEQLTGAQNKAKIKEFVMHPKQSMWALSYLLQGSWSHLGAIEYGPMGRSMTR